MVSPTSPRIFTLYDILGVMVPGITLFAGLLLFLPDPPAPTEAWEYLLYGIVAFSLGYVVQFWASKAVGELKTFENTMDEIRNPLEPSGTTECSAPSETKEDAADGDNGDTDDQDEEEGRSIDTNASDREPTGAIGHVLYAFFGPAIWPCWSPVDKSIGNKLHANRVWKDVRDTYNLERGTKEYEELQQMIQSEVDNVRSPSRAYRFQAIRNFHRGMWISLWLASLFLVAALLNEWVSIFEIGFIHDTGGPYILRQEWWWVAIPTAVLTISAFWWLHVEYQREFVRYLIIDYFVKLRERDEADSGAD